MTGVRFGFAVLVVTLLTASGPGLSRASAEEPLQPPLVIRGRPLDAPEPFPPPPPPPPPPALPVTDPAWPPRAPVVRPVPVDPTPRRPAQVCPVNAAAPMRATPPSPYHYRSWCSPWIVSARISAWWPESSGTFQDGGDSVATPSGIELSYRAFQGQLEISRGAWTARFEKTYAGVSGDVFRVDGLPTVRAGAELDMDQTMIGYRLCPISLGFQVCSRTVFLSTEINAGARFYDVDVWAESVNLPVRLGTSEIDPVVGVRFDLPLTQKLKVTASGDIGGFGIGLDLSYMFLAEIDYRFSRHWSAQLGWRHLHMEKSVGPSGFELDWHATLTGPSLAIKYTF